MNEPKPGEEASDYCRCDEPYPSAPMPWTPDTKMRPCWYPAGHATPHSWEAARPGETLDSRNERAFELPR